MALQDEQVKKAAELKMWLENRIAELQDEIERLKESLSYVDATLRSSEFRPASEIIDETSGAIEVREIKREKTDQVIATASVGPDRLSIEPRVGVTLNPATPPFKSFLVGKILEGMKSKDGSLVSSGKLAKGEQLRFSVREDGGRIVRLEVENYRDKSRLNEIVNTVGWTFSKMLEKQGPTARGRSE
jgi:uncharacterized small protein (DUF1192 family)